MENTRTFRASKMKAFLLLLGSICFVLGGLWMSNEKPIIGWLCVGFFGLGIPASLLMMFTNAMFLRLDEEGFEMGSLFGSKRIGWSDVLGFEISSIRGTKMIAIVYSEEYKQQKLARAVASAMSGMEGAIPNSYNASLSEIRDTLNSWRVRFGPGCV